MRTMIAQIVRYCLYGAAIGTPLAPGQLIAPVLEDGRLYVHGHLHRREGPSSRYHRHAGNILKSGSLRADIMVQDGWRPKVENLGWGASGSRPE